MKTNTERLQNFPLEGGALCLDFLNTVHDRTTDGELYDYLSGWEEWATWLVRAGVMDKSTRLHTTGDFNKIAETREVLFRIFKAIVDKKSIPEQVLEDYNSLLKATYGHLELRINDSNLLESLNFKNSEPLNYLFPILKSAHELLISDNVKHVKQCSNCGWLFLDTSKNKSRRWCNMQTCGSSQKAKRYYRRRKKAKR